MSEPTDDQINMKLAKFEGWTDFGSPDKQGVIRGRYKWYPRKPIPQYTDSLDSLIPVLRTWYFPPDAHRIFRLLRLIKVIAIAIIGKKSPSRELALEIYKVFGEPRWR